MDNKINHSAPFIVFWIPVKPRTSSHGLTARYNKQLSQNIVIKSFQSKWDLSINFNFHSHRHPFNRFSLYIVLSALSCCSKYTSFFIPYFFVNPSTKSFLCCQIRFIKSEVTPTYKIPFFLFGQNVYVKIFTHAAPGSRGQAAG